MKSTVWSVKSRLLASGGGAVALIGLVWLTMWLLGNTKIDDGAGTANVLALPVAVLGTAAALIGLRTRPPADDPTVLASRARRLLSRVVSAESRTLQQLLGDTGDPRPADIKFAQPEAALVQWRVDGGDRTGSLATIASYYAGLDRGRLVILGKAGAGKTVLAIRLLLDLAERTGQAEPGPHNQIPIRLSLPTFGNIDGSRDELDSWLAKYLSNVHGIELQVAAELVGRGWLLPVLDGLDEMDPDDQEPVRAREVLAALNLPAGTGRWSVVLTCRSERYGTIADEGDALQDATVVTMQALDHEQVIRWIAYRFPDPTQPDGAQQRWQPIIDDIRRNPEGPVAACLINPLHLYLAVTLYQKRDSEPAGLLHIDDVEDYLFAQLIPAVTTQHGQYDPGDVERWLRTFAAHLDRMKTYGASGTDIYLDDLWVSTGDLAAEGSKARRQAAVLVMALGAVPSIGIAVQYVAMTGSYRPLTLSHWFGLVAAISVLGYLFISTTKVVLHYPVDMSLRGLFRRDVLSTTAFDMVTSLLAAITAGVVTTFFQDNVNWLLTGLIMWPGMFFWTNSPMAVEGLARPSDSMRYAVIESCVAGGAIGLTTTCAAAITLPPTTAIFLGLTFVTVAALPRSPLPRYVVAVSILARTGALPPRPGRFLDWAYDAGLVRLSGIAVQFRHRELQARLTATTAALADTATP